MRFCISRAMMTQWTKHTAIADEPLTRVFLVRKGRLTPQRKFSAPVSLNSSFLAALYSLHSRICLLFTWLHNKGAASIAYSSYLLLFGGRRWSALCTVLFYYILPYIEHTCFNLYCFIHLHTCIEIVDITSIKCQAIHLNISHTCTSIYHLCCMS